MPDPAQYQQLMSSISAAIEAADSLGETIIAAHLSWIGDLVSETADAVAAAEEQASATPEGK